MCILLFFSGELIGVDYLYSQTNQPLPLPLDLVDPDSDEAMHCLQASECGDDCENFGRVEDEVDLEDQTVPTGGIALRSLGQASCTASSPEVVGMPRQAELIRNASPTGLQTKQDTPPDTQDHEVSIQNHVIITEAVSHDSLYLPLQNFICM